MSDTLRNADKLKVLEVALSEVEASIERLAEGQLQGWEASIRIINAFTVRLVMDEAHTNKIKAILKAEESRIRKERIDLLKEMLAAAK